MADSLMVCRGPRDLWASVLLLGLFEHTLGRDREWLATADFEQVSWMAGFDPDEIRSLVYRLDAVRLRCLGVSGAAHPKDKKKKAA